MRFIYFLAYRILSALFIKTFYIPDEFFQSLEVAHRMAFGYGVVTWEWKAGLRSFLYPLFFSFAYYVLELFGLDKPYYLILVPRLMEACLAATGDYLFTKFVRQHFGDRTANIMTFFLLSNWYIFTTGVRVLTNAVEMSLLLIVLYLYPFIIEKGRSYWQYMILAAFAFCVRCTCIVVFIPIGISHLYRDWDSFYRSFKKAILPSLLLLGISIAIDSYFCQKFVFNPYNFFHFNILEQGSKIFGTKEFTHYLFPILPCLLHLLVVPFVWQLAAMFKRRKDGKSFIVWQIAGTLLFSLFVTSMNPHKEERFILPLLPLAIFLASLTVVEAEQWLRKKNVKYTRFLIIWLMATTAIADTLMIVKKGRFDGRGRVTVVQMLADTLEEDAHLQGRNASILFLGECFGYPLASGIHQPIPTRYVACGDQGHYMQRSAFWLHAYIDKLGKSSDDITHLFFLYATHFYTALPMTNWLGFTKDIRFDINTLPYYKDNRATDSILVPRDYSERQEWLATRELPRAQAV